MVIRWATQRHHMFYIHICPGGEHPGPAASRHRRQLSSAERRPEVGQRPVGQVQHRRGRPDGADHAGENAGRAEGAARDARRRDRVRPAGRRRRTDGGGAHPVGGRRRRVQHGVSGGGGGGGGMEDALAQAHIMLNYISLAV